mmetsp:Transcript_33754/g.100704  ORF Transcript_33754/g.100704 Transcript_33754/m.100704 type:complete len:366 (-) Transcript_33754:837-1934(-)
MLLEASPSRAGLVGIQGGRPRRGRGAQIIPRHRTRAIGDHGSRIGGAAPRQPRRERHTRGERGGVQLQGGVRTSRDTVQSQDRIRLRVHPSPVRPARTDGRAPQQAAGHVLLHPVRQGEGSILRVPGSHRHHAPVHRLGERRIGVRELGDEEHDRGMRQISEFPPRPRLLLQGGSGRRIRALVRAAMGPGPQGGIGSPPLREISGRRPPSRVRKVGRTAHDVRRAVGGTPLGRTRFVHRRFDLRPSRRSTIREVSQAPFLHGRAREQPRSRRREEGGGLFGDDSSFVHVHARRGGRRHSGRDQIRRDVRRDHHTRVDSHVSHGAQDQGDGDQDGIERGGGRRGLWRVPLLPQGSQREGIVRRDGR